MRFQQTYCSQCGKNVGPGDAGVSECSEHTITPLAVGRFHPDEEESDWSWFDRDITCDTGCVDAVVISQVDFDRLTAANHASGTSDVPGASKVESTKADPISPTASSVIGEEKPNDPQDLRKAAFVRVMGDTNMPDDGEPSYDEWLFNRAWDAAAELVSASTPRTSLQWVGPATEAYDAWLAERDKNGLMTDRLAAWLEVWSRASTPQAAELKDEQIEGVWLETYGYRPGLIARRDAIDFARAILAASRLPVLVDEGEGGQQPFVHSVVGSPETSDAPDSLDAARYRWLRSIGHAQLNVFAHYAGPELDNRIDAAMKDAA